MLHDDTIRLLQGGCGLIVASVGSDGAPCAARGWGLTVLDGGDDVRVRLLLDADDPLVLEGVAAGRSIAITGSDVPTLHSIQMKGTAMSLEPATAADEEKAAQFADDFFTDIGRTDGTSRELLDLLMPSRFVACEVAIDETFDQTPGPDAGARLAPRRR